LRRVPPHVRFNDPGEGGGDGVDISVKISALFIYHFRLNHDGVGVIALPDNKDRNNRCTSAQGEDSGANRCRCLLPEEIHLYSSMPLVLVRDKADNLVIPQAAHHGPKALFPRFHVDESSTIHLFKVSVETGEQRPFGVLAEGMKGVTVLFQPSPEKGEVTEMAAEGDDSSVAREGCVEIFLADDFDPFKNLIHGKGTRVEQLNRTLYHMDAHFAGNNLELPACLFPAKGNREVFHDPLPVGKENEVGEDAELFCQGIRDTERQVRNNKIERSERQPARKVIEPLFQFMATDHVNYFLFSPASQTLDSSL